MFATAKRVLRRYRSGGRKLGEIKHDEFYEVIRQTASRADVRTILEIGASTGDGSTEALVAGMGLNPSKPKLFSIEAVTERFEVLQRRYAGNPAVTCFNVSSVGESDYPSEDRVRAFLRSTVTNLRDDVNDTVVGWLRGERAYLSTHAIPPHGIQRIKSEFAIETFDAVLIDGSEFTGTAELDLTYGSRVVMLDDINAYKNHYNCQRLLNDPKYRLTSSNLKLRNGFAVFELA